MIKFKTPLIEDRFDKVHPVLQDIIRKMGEYSVQQFEIPLTVTSALSTEKEDIKLKRVHLQHRQGRAVDLSIKGFYADQLHQMARFFNTLFLEYAAFTEEKGSQLVLIKKDHLHVAIRHITNLSSESYKKQWG